MGDLGQPPLPVSRKEGQRDQGYGGGAEHLAGCFPEQQVHVTVLRPTASPNSDVGLLAQGQILPRGLNLDSQARLSSPQSKRKW